MQSRFAEYEIQSSSTILAAAILATPPHHPPGIQPVA
jgi:hypothetical protein